MFSKRVKKFSKKFHKVKKITINTQGLPTGVISIVSKFCLILLKIIDFYKEVHSEHSYQKVSIFFLKTSFFTFLTPGIQKCKKIPGPIIYRILSLFLLNQFLFCKRCLIGFGGIVIWKH